MSFGSPSMGFTDALGRVFSQVSCVLGCTREEVLVLLLVVIKGYKQ